MSMKKILLAVVGLMLFLNSVPTYAGQAYIPNWQSSTTYGTFFGLCISNITGASQTVSYVLYDANGTIALQESKVLGAHQTWLINTQDPGLTFGYGTITGESALVAQGYVRAMTASPGIMSVSINGGNPF